MAENHLQNIKLDMESLGYEDQKQNFSFEEYFEIEKLSTYLKGQSEKLKNIVLQFPVKSLALAIQIQQKLNKFIEKGQQIYLLSDHLKNDCCADIIGALHVKADILIHFGYPCYSEGQNAQELEIIHILPKRFLNLQESVQNIDNYAKNNDKTQIYLLIPDLFYTHLTQIIQQSLSHLDNVICAQPYVSSIQSQQYLFYGYFIGSSIPQDFNVIILSETLSLNTNNNGHESMSLLQKMFFVKNKFKIKNISVLDGSNMIQIDKDFYSNHIVGTANKRYHLIQKAKNSKCFGLLILNPNSKFGANLLEKLKLVIKNSNKKCYCFVMNSISETKLSNFPEIDCYVVISCYNSCQYDFKTFYKLLITPYELILALQIDTFPEYFILDDNNLEIEENYVKDDNENEFQPIQEVKREKKQIMELQPINTQNKVAVQSIFQTYDHFKSRLYQGLEIDQQKEVIIAQQGLKGIAQQYENEKK